MEIEDITEQMTVVPEGEPSKEIEIEIVDTRPVEDQVEPADAEEVEASGDEEPTEEELKELGGRVQKRINKLTFKFNEERRRADSATKMQEEAILWAQHQQKENLAMRKIMEQGEEVLLAEVRSRTSSDVEQAKQAHISAIEEGESQKISETMMVLNRAQMDQHQAEQHKLGQYTGGPQEAAQAPQVQQVQQGQQGPAKPVEDKGFAEWRGKNEWFDSNSRMNAVAMVVHKELQESSVSTGVIVGSDEYYSQIDSAMKQEFPAFFNKTEENPGVEANSKPSANPAPSVVAPSSRNNATQSPRKVQINESERALAERLGLPIELYAKNKLELEQKRNV